MDTKKLVNYFSQITASLEAASHVFNSIENTSNIGTARELLVSKFLQNVLPSYFTFNSGEIFDSSDQLSGQIDIIISPITCPKLHITDKISLFPVESVMNAIEVKSVLTTGSDDNNHLSKSLKTCSELKSMKKISTYKSRLFDSDHILYSLFAFRGPDIDTMKRHLIDSGKNIVNLPDMIVVTDKGYSLRKVSNWYNIGESVFDNYKVVEDKRKVLFSYFNYFIDLSNEFIENTNQIRVPIESYEQTFTTLLDKFDEAGSFLSEET